MPERPGARYADPPVTVSLALREGFRRAFSRLWPALALFAAGAGELFAATSIPLLLVAALASGDARVLWSGAAALLSGWLLCRLARAVILYAALGPREGGWVLRALGSFALTSALELTVRAWWWAGAIGSWLAYLRWVGEGAAAGPSLALSVTLAGGMFLGLFAAVWTDLALARSAARAERFSASLAEAARSLAVRPWAPLWVVAVTALLRWMVEMGGSALSAPAGPLSPARVLAGLLAALGWAVLELARLGALQALDRDPVDPVIPAQPVEPPPPAPQPILDALPVDAPGSAG